jgi:pyridoxal phosphate enzyme (YggS family)
MVQAMADTLNGRLAAVEARIVAACERSGRARSAVQLVGVTKGMEAAVVREAVAAGLSCFGENYVQEWVSKRAALAELTTIEWHFIGRVQRNKAAAVAEARLVHSLADLRVAAALEAAGARREAPVCALVQVNLEGEVTKGGVAPAALPEFLAALHGREWLRVEGLMAIPPPLDPGAMRGRFRALRELRDRQAEAARLRELSMGMSADFEVAIEEGATLVRVGTAIFGPRKGM